MRLTGNQSRLQVVSLCVQHRNNPAQNPESKIPADIFTPQFSYLWTEARPAAAPVFSCYAKLKANLRLMESDEACHPNWRTIPLTHSAHYSLCTCMLCHHPLCLPLQISAPRLRPHPPIYGCYASPWWWPSWKVRGDPSLCHLRGEYSDPPSVNYTLGIQSPKIHASWKQQGTPDGPRRDRNPWAREKNSDKNVTQKVIKKMR